MKTLATAKDYTRISGLILILLLSAGLSELKAQLILGSRTTAMGQAVTALPSDEWQVFGNPAMMNFEDNAASFYGIRYYGFSELTDMALSGVYNHNFGTFGVGMHTYGDDIYRESRFRLAYAREYAGIRAGLVVNYTHFSIQDYGSAGSVVFDFGMAYTIIDGLWLGARATNLTQSTVGEAEEELPREMAVGISWSWSDRTVFTSDLVKDVRFPLSWRGGLEVRVVDQFVLRGGVTTEPLTYSAGMGYSMDRWGINIVAQQHHVLGWSPGLDLRVSF